MLRRTPLKRTGFKRKPGQRLKRSRLNRKKKARPRLDRDRFDGLPIGKRVRIVDEAVLEEARNRGYCEWCGRPLCRADPSHAVPVGRGGDDTVLNVTSSCRACHDRHHDGHEPTEAQLLALAAIREASRRPDGTHDRVIGKRLLEAGKL
jgi:hypothetical protein